MNKSLNLLILSAACGFGGSAVANTVTDVGVGLDPPYLPLHYDPATDPQPWTLSSSCVGINENGAAACSQTAVGPTYRCGFRLARRCNETVTRVHEWNGVDLEMFSDANAKTDVPLAINNSGWIGGYTHDSTVYPWGDYGLIWQTSQVRVGKPSPVVSLNDAGDYIQQSPNSGVFDSTGILIPYPGPLATPMRISNQGEVVGGQVIQYYVDALSSPTGNEIPDVSGIGWLLDQAAVAAIPLDPFGLYDIDRNLLWPAAWLRPAVVNGAITLYTTNVYDVNDFGDFVGKNDYGSLYNGFYCSHEGQTSYTDIYGVLHTVPWVCDSTNYYMGTYAGGKAFLGINNIGDAVGTFTPGTYFSYEPVVTHPWVWLVNSLGTRDEYNANDLLPPNSGYTVLSVNDINNQRQIVGTCLAPDGLKHGCIINVTDPAIPADTVKPSINIDAPLAGDTVSGVVSIQVSAFDRQSRMRLVFLKIDNVYVGKDLTRPYNFEWDTTNLTPGTTHTIRAVAVDNAGNGRIQDIQVTVGSIAPPPPPPPPPAPTGTVVDGAGTITAIGVDYLEVDGTPIYFDAQTQVKLNDVPGYAVGLAVQYSGVQDDTGRITATYIEVN